MTDYSDKSFSFFLRQKAIPVRANNLTKSLDMYKRKEDTNTEYKDIIDSNEKQKGVLYPTKNLHKRQKCIQFLSQE